MHYQRWHYTINEGARGYEFAIRPRTALAAKFVEKYGDHLVVRESGQRAGNPFVEVVNVHGVVFEVEKRDDGIFVNGEFFAKDWNEDGKESTSS